MTPRVLIIGSGSIAKRHYQVSEELGFSPKIYSPTESRRRFLLERNYNVIDKIDEDFDLSIICSVASRHMKDIYFIHPFSKCILVEKPIIPFQQYDQLKLFDLGISKKVYIGFNKRFEGGIQQLKSYLESDQTTIKYASFSCYSDLENWRKDSRPISSSPSLSQEHGGVVNELSHEIDLAEYLVGPINSISGHKWTNKYFSSGVEDSSSILACHSNSNIPSQINISFSSSLEQRYIYIKTANGNLLHYNHQTQELLRLKKGTILDKHQYTETRNMSFRRQLQSLLFKKDKLQHCNFDRALHYQKLLNNLL